MLFTAALQLANPWKVIDVSFRDAAGGKRELRITVGYGPGSRFHCPEAKCREESCPVHDTAERTWRHSDFFQYKAHIHALVPRVACQAHGVRTVPVPWARPGSGVREHLSHAHRIIDMDWQRCVGRFLRGRVPVR